jgi:hypothetical protein
MGNAAAVAPNNDGGAGPIGGGGPGPIGTGGPGPIGTGGSPAILQAIAHEFAELSDLFRKLSKAHMGNHSVTSQPGDGVDFTPQIAFSQQPQERFNWCWIAVAASVHDLFETGSTQQSDLANKLLDRSDCNQVGNCDQGGSLGEALDKVKHLAASSRTLPNPEELSMKFEDIAAELERQKKPLCIYIDWGQGGEGHFCVISGCKQVGDEQYLYVNDPLFGSGPQPYSRVLSNYNLEQGKWTYTYRLKP